MTNYQLKPFTTLPTLQAQHAKAERKKLLEEVRKRRYQIAAERRIKEQNAYNTNEEFRDYQDTIASNL